MNPVIEVEASSEAASESRLVKLEPIGCFSDVSGDVSVEPTALKPETQPKITLGRSSVQFVKEAGEEIQWLIHGVLPTGAIVFMSGRPGDMKTWIAMSMARAVAAGEPWLGRQTTQGPVLYLDGEMPKDVMGNYLHWVTPVEQLSVSHWTDPDFPNGLAQEELRQAAKHYRLIVVDTLRRQMGDKKENSPDDMTQITKDLRELTRYGATVLVLHHVPKNPENKGPRGATELLAGCDVSILVSKKPKKEGCSLVLEMHKTRYSASTDVTIQTTKGNRGPLFTIQDSGTGTIRKDELSELAALVNGLRDSLGCDPIKSQVIRESQKAGLGGRGKVEALLAKGEGTHWCEQRGSKSVSYAPATAV